MGVTVGSWWRGRGWLLFLTAFVAGIDRVRVEQIGHTKEHAKPLHGISPSAFPDEYGATTHPLVAGSGASPSFLVINTIPGSTGVVRWPQMVATNLTWCVDDKVAAMAALSPLMSLGNQNVQGRSAKTDVVLAMKLAASQWERAANVRFPYVDNIVCDASADVWLRLETSRLLVGNAAATAPILQLLSTYSERITGDPGAPWALKGMLGKTRTFLNPKKLNTIQINAYTLESLVFLRDVLVHEIGHALGFRHEHILGDNRDRACTESLEGIAIVNSATFDEEGNDELGGAKGSNTTDSRREEDKEEEEAELVSAAGMGDGKSTAAIETALDLDSVMTYSMCGGSQHRGFELSDGDKTGVKMIYGASKWSGSYNKVVEFSGYANSEATALHSVEVGEGPVIVELQVSVQRELDLPREPPNKGDPCLQLEMNPRELCSHFHLPVRPNLRCALENDRGFSLDIDKLYPKNYRPAIQNACQCRDDECDCWLSVLRVAIATTGGDYRESDIIFSFCRDSGRGRYVLRKFVSPAGFHVSRQYNYQTHLEEFSFTAAMANITRGEHSTFPRQSHFNVTLRAKYPHDNVGYNMSIMYQKYEEKATITLQRETTLSQLGLTTEAMEKLVKANLSSTSGDGSIEVEVLDVAGNRLEELPPFISQCRMLRILNAESNELRSISLVDMVVSHPHLSSASFVANQLDSLETGREERDLGDVIPVLANLDLSYNNLRDISVALARLPLTQFRATGNNLRRIPESMFHNSTSRLSNTLRTLELEHNEIADVQDSICDLPRLRVLKLSNNRIESVPGCLWTETELNTLHLAHNRLTSLPEANWPTPNALTSLDLAFNNLTAVPQSLFDVVRNVQTLNIQGNALTSIPRNINNLMQLRSLDLSHNRLTEFPVELVELRATLAYLDLRHNRLGHLPPSFGELHQLTQLLLSSNRLKSIPAGVMHMRVEDVELSDNELESLPQLEKENKHTAVLPNAKLVNLANNRLTHIPREISWMQGLRHLVLRNNQLTSLPSEIGILMDLIALDLSHNRLSSLPLSVGALLSLEELSVRHNNMTRFLDIETPLLQRANLTEAVNMTRTNTSRMFLPALKSLDLSHNRIEGFPIEGLPSQSLVDVNLSNNKIGFVDISTFASSYCGPLVNVDMGYNGISYFDFLRFLSNCRNVLRLRLNSNDLTSLGTAPYLVAVKCGSRSNGKLKTVTGAMESPFLFLEESSVHLEHQSGQQLAHGRGYWNTDEADAAAEREWSDLTDFRSDLPIHKSSDEFRQHPGQIICLHPGPRIHQLHLRRGEHPLKELDIRSNRLGTVQHDYHDLTQSDVLENVLTWFCDLQILLSFKSRIGGSVLRANYYSRREVVEALLSEQIDYGYFGQRGCSYKTMPDYVAGLGVKEVDMSGNQLAELPYPTVESDVAPYEALRTLNLRLNLLTSIPAWVLALPNLRELRVYGNRISHVTAPETPNYSIKRLTISNNLLKSLSFMDKLPGLALLTADSNKIVELSTLPGRSSTLSSSPLTLSIRNNPLRDLPPEWSDVHFQQLDVCDCEISSLPSSFKDLQVMFFALDRNKFETLHLSTVPRTVRLISFEENGMSEIIIDKASQDKNETWHIDHVDLKKNSLSSVPIRLIEHSLNLDLSENRFTTVPPVTKLRQLRINSNRISSVPKEIFSSLVELEASNNSLSSFPALNSTGCPDLCIIRANNNKITSVGDVFVNCPKVKSIDLSHNKLQRFPDFPNAPRLSHVDLSYNQLTRVELKPRQHVQEKAWWSFSFNNITELPEWFLDHTYSICAHHAGNPLSMQSLTTLFGNMTNSQHPLTSVKTFSNNWAGCGRVWPFREVTVASRTALIWQVLFRSPSPRPLTLHIGLVRKGNSTTAGLARPVGAGTARGGGGGGDGDTGVHWLQYGLQIFDTYGVTSHIVFDTATGQPILGDVKLRTKHYPFVHFSYDLMHNRTTPFGAPAPDLSRGSLPRMTSGGRCVDTDERGDLYQDDTFFSHVTFNDAGQPITVKEQTGSAGSTRQAHYLVFNGKAKESTPAKLYVQIWPDAPERAEVRRLVLEAGDHSMVYDFDVDTPFNPWIWRTIARDVCHREYTFDGRTQDWDRKDGF